MINGGLSFVILTTGRPEETKDATEENRSMRLACAIVLVMGLVLPARAQDERGWSFSGSFGGSSNSGGTVMKTEPVLGYTVNNHFQTYVGMPLYFVNLSATPSPMTAPSTTSGFENGIGNAFLGFRYSVQNDALNYSSTLELTAPTGDKSRVFETQAESLVPAEIADDHGVSAWFGVSPSSAVDFHAGYSRSIHYDFNTVFFGVGFHLGK